MPKLDQLVNGLVGAAFGIRAFDGRRPVWARVAYGAVGFDLLRAAYYGEPVLQPAAVGGERAVSGSVISRSTGAVGPALKFQEHKLKTKNIGERVAYVHTQALNGTRDPKVYSLARAVVSRKCGNDRCIPERDHKGEMAALFAEVRSRVRYTLDPTDFDAFSTPGKTLELRAGDCDDETALLAALLRSIGLQVRSRVVQTKGFDTFNHIYLAAHDPTSKQWVPLDPTVNKPAGWEVPDVSVVQKKDFLIVEKGLPRLG